MKISTVQHYQNISLRKANQLLEKALQKGFVCMLKQLTDDCFSLEVYQCEG